ncbi:MAG: ABC transporter ATP-binding protein, partial [Bdellovibrionales bacterium]|nr:ABC transporter ATP-binding protein [Bdellovibrionales bacterium]
MESPVYECCNLSFSYGTTSVLKNISFCVREGEHVALVGPNGSGKTTLLRCLLGILPTPKGEILFRGKTLSSPREQAREVGYVPQGVHVTFDYCVQDLLEVSRYACLSPLSSLGIEDRKG